MVAKPALAFVQKYRPNHRVVVFVFFMTVGMLIWTQYSVLKISIKKYRKKLGM